MNQTTRTLKRSIDLTVASAVLVVFSPVMLLVALLIKLTSSGPILYRQRRCGAERRLGRGATDWSGTERRNRDGWRTFEMYKFRTMVVNAESSTGACLATRNDPRTTPLGKWLRKTRLDELPQLWNVLRGDMSIVGPRPERPELMGRIEEQIPFFQERMRFIKPGITGLAQVHLNYDGSFRGENARSRQLSGHLTQARREGQEADPLGPFANKLLYDVAYGAMLERPSEALRTDLSIMAKTPWVMVSGRGQ
jgi:lipopolysaccharide/colanic/teichoic acid biosynthesis glycosyltransferase